MNLQPLQQQHMIGGLPYRPPQQLIPQVNVSPQMGEHIRDCAGFVLLTLQTLANNNPMRLCLYYTAANNGFQNQLYYRLVEDVAYLAESTYLSHNQQYPIGSCIEQAAGVLCKHYTSLITEQHPALKAKLDQRGMQDHQQTLMQAQQMTNMLENLRRQAFGGMQNNFQQQGQFGVRGQGGYARNTMPMNRQVMNMHYGNTRSHYAHGRSLDNQNNRDGTDRLFAGKPGGGTDSYMMLAGESIPDKPVNRGPTVVTPAGFSNPAETFIPPAMIGMPLQTNTVPQNVAETTTQQGKEGAMTIFPKGEFVYQDFKLAYSAFYKNPPIPKGLPHGTLYDMSTHAMFYNLTTPGKVSEIGLKLKDIGGMQPYEEHETHHLLHPRKAAPRAVQDIERARKAFMDVLQAEDISVELDAREQLAAAEGTGIEKMMLTTPVKLGNICLTGEFEPSYIAILDTWMKTRDIEVETQRTVFFPYRGAESWVLTGEAGIQALSLPQARSWSALKNAMVRFNAATNPAIAKLVNDRLVAAINELVRRTMGIEAKISEFIEDIEDLRDHLRKVYGDRIADIFDQEASSIAQRALLFIEDEDNSGNVIWIKEEWIYVLNCDLQDITYGHSGNAATVMKSRTPELYRVLAQHFEMQDADPDGCHVRNVKLITRDGRGVIYALRSVYQQDTFLVYSER